MGNKIANYCFVVVVCLFLFFFMSKSLNWWKLSSLDQNGVGVDSSRGDFEPEYVFII